MKRLFTIMAVAVILFSCSSDDTSPRPSIAKATIDGVMYNFNTFSITQENFTDETHTYTDVTITASIDADPSNIFTIIIEEKRLGTNASYYFAYFLDQTALPKTDSFITDVTLNSGNRVMGTFSGDVIADDGSGDTITITNGSFDVSY